MNVAHILHALLPSHNLPIVVVSENFATFRMTLSHDKWTHFLSVAWVFYNTK